MSGYTKPCIFCNQEIRMSNDTGKWQPFNLDNSPHECRDRDKQTQPQPQTQPIKPALTLEEIQTRLERLEAEVFKNQQQQRTKVF